MCALASVRNVSKSFYKCNLLGTGVDTCVQVATAYMHACARMHVRASVQLSARGRVGVCLCASA